MGVTPSLALGHPVSVTRAQSPTVSRVHLASVAVSVVLLLTTSCCLLWSTPNEFSSPTCFAPNGPATALSLPHPLPGTLESICPKPAALPVARLHTLLPRLLTPPTSSALDSLKLPPPPPPGSRPFPPSRNWKRLPQDQLLYKLRVPNPDRMLVMKQVRQGGAWA